MISGIPDLWVIIPGYLPVLLEAKWMGEVKRDNFSRKVPFTAMQTNWIKECDDVCAYSAMGLIGIKYHNRVYASLVKYGTPQFYNFTQSFICDTANVLYQPTEKLFDISTLFAKVPIPRLQAKNGHQDLKYDRTAEMAI